MFIEFLYSKYHLLTLLGLQENVQEESMAYIYVFVGLVIALFQIGTLCMIGQWLTSKSDDVLDASYQCHWYNQSKRFKNTLIVLRTECQREMNIGVLEFRFNRAFFYEVNFLYFILFFKSILNNSYLFIF